MIRCLGATFFLISLAH